jgi:RNA polymerase sigma factor for flagellar operon FliA
MQKEEALWRAWKNFLKNKRDLASRDFLAQSYLYLVDGETRRLLARLPSRVYWEKKDDLASAGAIGLLKALDMFTPPPEKKSDPGRAFEAYSRYRIRGQMVDELRGMDFARRNLRKQARLIQEAEKRLETKFQRNPIPEETAKALGVELEVFYDWVAEINMLNLLSLDAEIQGQGDGGAWVDSIVDEKAENPLDKVEIQEKIERVTKALIRLGDSEQKVLQLYYVETLTFKEIGKVLQVSESRVCQIHHMAVFHLQELVEGGKAHGSHKGSERLHDYHYRT